MKIGIWATGQRAQSWRNKFDTYPNISWVQDTQRSKEFDVFIDLNWDENPQHLLHYSGNTHTLFILGSNFLTLEQGLNQLKIPYQQEKLIGINSFPYLLEQNSWEACNPFKIDIQEFIAFTKILNIPQIEWLNSRVGFFIPRVLCMIINEAYYTVQEGTAQKQDIDTAMKLGTNYPKGPFEFAESFSLPMVYKQLESLYLDTQDERYKICSLLKTEYLHYTISNQ